LIKMDAAVSISKFQRRNTSYRVRLRAISLWYSDVNILSGSINPDIAYRFVWRAGRHMLLFYQYKTACLCARVGAVLRLRRPMPASVSVTMPLAASFLSPSLLLPVRTATQRLNSCVRPSVRP